MPSDNELFAIFNSAQGDSSYDGWAALYEAGRLEGRRTALNEVRDIIRVENARTVRRPAPSDDDVRWDHE